MRQRNAEDLNLISPPDTQLSGGEAYKQTQVIRQTQRLKGFSMNLKAFETRSVKHAIWRYRLGLLLITVSTIAWSTAGYFTRLIPLDTWTLLFWRGAFGALGIFLFMLAYERRDGPTQFRHLGNAGWAYVLASTVGGLCFVASLKRTSVAHASIIYATVPLLAAGLAWLVMRERVSRSTLLASIAALAGVTLMMGVGDEGTLLGDVLALGMTLCMAIMMVIGRRYQSTPMLPAACLSAALGMLMAVPFASWSLPSAVHMGQLALFGLANSALGLALFAIGSKMLPAAETALIGALDAPLAPIWVMIAFGEIPSITTIAGGTIVFVAILTRMLLGGLSTGATSSP